jgi:hypothetical protein
MREAHRTLIDLIGKYTCSLLLKHSVNSHYLIRGCAVSSS